MNPKIVSTRLGHATVAFTLDTYTEDVPEPHHAAVETVSGLFLDDAAEAPDEPPIHLPVSTARQRRCIDAMPTGSSLTTAGLWGISSTWHRPTARCPGRSIPGIQQRNKPSLRPGRHVVALREVD